MANISRENKIAEAVKRMKALSMYDPVIEQFQSGQVSESSGPFGACYWLTDEQKERVETFEQEHDALVYHVIRGKYVLGGTDSFEMETYLYVSDYEEEWEEDMEGLRNGEQLCYVNNVTCPDFSEFGYVGIELSSAGGLRRSY